MCGYSFPVQWSMALNGDREHTFLLLAPWNWNSRTGLCSDDWPYPNEPRMMTPWSTIWGLSSHPLSTSQKGDEFYHMNQWATFRPHPVHRSCFLIKICIFLLATQLSGKCKQNPIKKMCGLTLVTRRAKLCCLRILWYQILRIAEFSNTPTKVPTNHQERVGQLNKLFW